MTKTSKQFPLPLSTTPPSMAVDDFMETSSNADALRWVNAWPNWPTHCLIISGPVGCGKTHLAHVWESRAHAHWTDASTTAGHDWQNLIKHKNIVVDNAAKLAGSQGGEEFLFHLYNALKEQGGYLLLTAPMPAREWGIGLPDLKSRILASASAAIEAPDDNLITALLIKQFHDRQLNVGGDVIHYILPRVERTPAALQKLVHALDAAALAEKRNITTALVREYFERHTSA